MDPTETEPSGARVSPSGSASGLSARSDRGRFVLLAGAGLLATVGLVLICYWWLDRPIAWFVHDHDLRRFAILRIFTHIPDGLVIAATLVLLAAPWRLGMRHALGRGERIALAASVSLALAVFVKNELKVIFGRAWPETWVHHNLSLIHDHVYGFFWFQTSDGFHSFPSGHTTVTFAVLSVFWLASPRSRPVAVLAAMMVIVGLIGMDYHFLSDVVAGGFLGSLCGVTVWRFWPRLSKG